VHVAKALLSALALLLLIVSPVPAEDGDAFCLVQIRDHSKAEAYSIMPETELKELQATIKLETRLHSRALTLASKEWRKDEQLKKKNYPRSAVAVRKVKILGTFKTMERAEMKRATYEERDANREERREEQNKERDKVRYGGDKTRASKAMSRLREKEFLYEQAAGLFSEALQALMAPPEEKEDAPDEE